MVAGWIMGRKHEIEGCWIAMYEVPQSLRNAAIGFWTHNRLKKSHEKMSSRKNPNRYCIIALHNSSTRAKNSGL
jgi:hypothetical protein